MSNLIVVTSGTKHFFEQAGLGDYLIITMRADYYGDDTNEKNVKKFLKSKKNVDSYTVDPCMYLATSNVGFEDERKLESSGTMIFSSYDISQQKFFDMENREITGMEDGTIYLPAGFMEKNNVTVGEKIIISSENGYRKKFKVVGRFKDAFLGSDMMGVHRYLLSS